MLNNSEFICYSTPSTIKSISLDSLNNINITNINHKLDTELSYFNKITHLINVLNNIDNKKYFIFTGDVVYIKQNIEEWNNLETFINGNKDIYFIRDPKGNINTEFFIIKNNKNIMNIIKFFNEVLNTINESQNTLDEQTIINKIKHKFNHGFIPNDYVIYENVIYNKNKCLIHMSKNEEQINKIASDLLSI